MIESYKKDNVESITGNLFLDCNYSENFYSTMSLKINF